MVKFTTSTNIIRDTERDISYISTPNGRKVFNRLISNFKTGHHAFNLIGSYGTGKSSFLWAFEKNLKGEHYYFEPLNGQFGGIKSFNFLKIVGDAASLREVLNSQLEISSNAEAQETLSALESLYSKVSRKGQLLVIEIDEFGKFLEHAAKTNPEKELYFIQQLAEFVNNPERQIMLITTLHQNFGAYARGLTVDQKLEWDKVKGRIMDIAFDEPVEQLLYLASEKIQSLDIKSGDTKAFQKLFSTINKSRLLANAEQLDKSLAEKLFPLDYLSAYILVQALQKYGQNERSLFTFLAAQDEIGISKFNEKGTYHVGKVYDYLVEYLSSELEDKDSNPHKSTWKAMGDAIDQVEVLNGDDTEDLVELIKVIGLANLFTKNTGLLDENVLSDYAELALAIPNASALVEKLKAQRIVKYFRAKKKLFFQSGTDLDFEEAYAKAKSELPPVENVVELLHSYLEFNKIPAKRIQYEKGTPRYFEFTLNAPEDLNSILDAVGQTDGFIHLVFSEKSAQKPILNRAKELNSAHLFANYTDEGRLKNQLFEINVVDHVLNNIADDEWAKKILLEERDHLIHEFKETILKGLYDPAVVTWYNQGKKINIGDYRTLNRSLSRIAENAYPSTPVYRNEMVNKEVLSGPILTARKKLIEQLLDNHHEENIGFADKAFPPEKTIYLSLLKETGIHYKDKGQWTLGRPTDKSFDALWERCEQFLKDSIHQRKNLLELYQMLGSEELKLKRGFIDYWIPIFLFIKQQDFALFHIEQGYIPYLKSQVFDLIHKKPENYQIKGYELDGVKVDLFNKYKEITGVAEDSKGRQDSFIKIFSNFFIFYNQLPDYTKKTKRLSPEALNLREAIKNAKEPEQALLEQFPNALGFNSINLQDEGAMESFVQQLNTAIYEIRTAFQELVVRVEDRLKDSLDLKGEFKPYQKAVYKRFDKIKEHLLTPKQRVLYKRLMSKIDEQEHYVISIADGIIGKDIHKLTDDEEPVLLDRLPEALHDLERLIPLQELQEERKEDEVFYYELHKTQKEPIKEKVTLSKKDLQKAGEVEKEIIAILEKHKGISKAVLLKIIQDKL